MKFYPSFLAICYGHRVNDIRKQYPDDDSLVKNTIVKINWYNALKEFDGLIGFKLNLKVIDDLILAIENNKDKKTVLDCILNEIKNSPLSNIVGLTEDLEHYVKNWKKSLSNSNSIPSESNIAPASSLKIDITDSELDVLFTELRKRGVIKEDDEDKFIYTFRGGDKEIGIDIIKNPIEYNNDGVHLAGLIFGLLTYNLADYERDLRISMPSGTAKTLSQNFVVYDNGEYKKIKASSYHKYFYKYKDETYSVFSMPQEKSSIDKAYENRDI